MLNFIEYYYGYVKSLLGFNYINPDNQVLHLDELPDEFPELTEQTALLIDNPVYEGKQTYLYYSYKNYGSNFAARGFTKDKTNAMIQNAFNEMSKVSGLKILPWRKGLPVNFSIQFSSQVYRNALAVMDKNKMIISSVRPMTENVFKTVIQHELLHFLKYKASPPADQWYHSTDKNCVYNINGNAPKLCAAEVNWLKTKYGS